MQELSIVMTTKRGPNEVKLLPDPKKISFIDLNATNTFMEQHEWKLYKFVKISEKASYDEIRTKADLKKSSIIKEINSNKQFILHSKIVASCFVSRKYFFCLFYISRKLLIPYCLAICTEDNSNDFDLYRGVVTHL